MMLPAMLDERCVTNSLLQLHAAWVAQLLTEIMLKCVCVIQIMHVQLKISILTSSVAPQLRASI